MKQKKKTADFDLFADFGAIDEGNIVAGAVMQAVEETKNRESEKKSQRIEDFGEKIGGARKDLYAAYCDLIRVAIETEVEDVPLSKSFPSPNYKKLLESGAESWKVDAVRALRDAIPLKPKKYSWRIREWADKVSVLRDMSVDVLENKWTAEEFSAELEKMKTRESEYGSSLRDIKFVAQRVEDTMLIYKVMGHEQDCSALIFAELEKYDYGYIADKLTQNEFLRLKEVLSLERKKFVAKGGSILTKRPVPQSCYSPAHAKSIEDATQIGFRLPTLSQLSLVHSESKGTDLFLSLDESRLLESLAKKSYNLVRWNFSNERKQLVQRSANKILENIAQTMEQLSALSHVEYINREKAFEKRGGCIFHSHRLPKWAKNDPKKFFQAADREIKFALAKIPNMVYKYNACASAH